MFNMRGLLLRPQSRGAATWGFESRGGEEKTPQTPKPSMGRKTTMESSGSGGLLNRGLLSAP